MPYSKCPLCGEMSHISVRDVEQWYREHYPGITVGSLVPGKCFYCWQELAEGDPIATRQSIGNESPVDVGTRGRIVKILASALHGDINRVQLTSGKDRYFVRGELRRLREDEV